VEMSFASTLSLLWIGPCAVWVEVGADPCTGRASFICHESNCAPLMRVERTFSSRRKFWYCCNCLQFLGDLWCHWILLILFFIFHFLLFIHIDLKMYKNSGHRWFIKINCIAVGVSFDSISAEVFDLD
jgi:hypothetical protein